MGEAELMEGNMADRTGTEGAARQLGRIFLYWCAGFGLLILLAFQSLTAMIVPSTSVDDASGAVALFGSIALGVFVMYIGVTTFKISHCEKRVIETTESGVRIAVLLVLSVLSLARGIWWIIDIGGGNATSIFNYIGMVWFMVAGFVGIPLAFLLFTARGRIRQQG